MKVLLYVIGAGIGAHGLIHLMGFVSYWPLGEVAVLPYKTTLAGSWEVGELGMKVYGLLWLIASLAFLAAVVGLVSRRTWWRPAMLGALLLSTALIALDWAGAFRGAIINAAILGLMGLSYFLPGPVKTR